MGRRVTCIFHRLKLQQYNHCWTFTIWRKWGIYMKSHYSCMVSENKIIVKSSAFKKNQARGQAGGTLIHCSLQRSYICNVSRVTNHLRFVNCNWHGMPTLQVLQCSAAVDITTPMTITKLLSIIPVSSNCTFEYNKVSNTQ